MAQINGKLVCKIFIKKILLFFSSTYCTWNFFLTNRRHFSWFLILSPIAEWRFLDPLEIFTHQPLTCKIYRKMGDKNVPTTVRINLIISNEFTNKFLTPKKFQDFNNFFFTIPRT